MSDEHTKRVIRDATKQFMETLAKATGALSLVITVQPDGSTRLLATIPEPMLTNVLMDAASRGRTGEKPS